MNLVLLAAPLLVAACADDPGDDGTAADGSGESSGGSTGNPTTNPSDPTADASSEATAEATGNDDCSTPDGDGDGHDAVICGGDDCDDADAFTHPGVEYDGWVQLVLHPMGGIGAQYHTWLTGSDGLVDIFWAFNSNLWHVAQDNDVVWGGPQQVGVGFEPRVALGLDGTYRMVYAGYGADLQSRGVFYTQIGSEQIHTLEELPVASPNPFGLDIEVDAATGTMHVVYGVLYEFPPTLRYATSSDGSNWTVETIAAEAAGFGGTVVLDDDGVPHVSFASNDNQVMHAVRTDGSWEVEVVANGYEVGATSMARDAEGELHIAFSVTGLEAAEDGLHYVRTEAGAWATPSEIDANVIWYDEIGLWDFRPAIAVGPGGQAHVAYHDYGAGVLRYATRIDGQWHARVIDDAQGPYTPQAGWYAQLDLEGGLLHISETSEATNEYKRFSFAPDDARDNDCDGMVDEGP